MDRATKETEISQIRDHFSRMTSAVFLDYKGMTVEQATKLRSEFRKVGVDYRVVKNTLTKQALKDEPFLTGLASALVGMTGIAWSYEDPSTAAKVIKAFRKEADGDKLKVKAAVVDGSILDSSAVETHLATMPGKDELRATLLATLQAPLQQFVALLQAPTQNFVYLLDAKCRNGDGD